MRAVQPDGDYEAIDPCVHFKDKERAVKWPPTVFVQGDADDVPGSGIESVERAVEELRGVGVGAGMGELKGAGVGRVEVVVVRGAGHMFDLAPGNEVGVGEMGASVKRALDFLRGCV